MLVVVLDLASSHNINRKGPAAMFQSYAERVGCTWNLDVGAMKGTW